MEDIINMDNISSTDLNNGNEKFNYSMNNKELKFVKANIKPNVSLKTNITQERQWATMTKYIPIDTHYRKVEIPVKQTKIINKPKIELVEKIKEIPKYIVQNNNKVIEVPEVKFVDKIEYDPIVIEKLKYVPKNVTKYNIIEKPVIKNIIKEKKVDVLQVQENVTYKDQEIVEEVYHYYNKDKDTIFNETENTSENQNLSNNENTININFDNPKHQFVDDNNLLPPILAPFGPQIEVTENKTIENVFIPKVEKIVEVEKKIDIPIDLPVPYIVPKPKIIDVEVPVFKFNDKYVPVPIRKKVIPKITWTDKVHIVDCLVEKPYLVYHNIIKIVPVDSKISVTEYPVGIKKINQEELYEADNLALWMRVNADLKQEKDKLKNQDVSSEHTCDCSNSDYCESISNTDVNSSYGGNTFRSSNESVLENLPLHPGHPLEMVHLQNKWLKQETTKTQDIYTDKFLDAHRNAIFNLTTQFPREAEIDIKQLYQLKEKMENKRLNMHYNE